MRVHIDEARQDVPARQIVDDGAGGSAIAGRGPDAPNAGALDLNRTVRQRDTADDINDRNVIEHQHR